MSLVSVIIPVYNGERYLADAIKSVQKQTYRDCELLVIDDGSTDGSAAVAKEFGDTIRYIHQANGGVCKARNAGIAAARGSYIAFLDQDDLWLPDKLADQVAYLENHPEIGAVYCQCKVTGEGWLRSDVYYTEPVKDDVIGVISGPCLLMTTTLFRKDVLHKIGGFDETLVGAGGEDMDLTVRLKQVAQVAYVPTVLAEYRMHGSNNSTHSERLLYNHGLYLRKCRDMYGHDPRVARFLDQRTVAYLSDLGNSQIKAGSIKEGRASLREAIRSSWKKQANAKMFMRSIRRLVRSYF